MVLAKVVYINLMFFLKIEVKKGGSGADFLKSGI